MSPLDPEIPPAGEEIHLPGPTILPLLTAAGITSRWSASRSARFSDRAASILTIVCVVRWIMDTRREIDELPLDHH